MAGRVVFDLEQGRRYGYALADLDHAGFEVAVTYDDHHGFLRWDGAWGRALYAYLLKHDEIVGFNVYAYDKRVMAGYLTGADRGLPARLREKTVDLHALLMAADGRRFSLQEVATNTLGEGKATPPVGYDPVLLGDYCERDVALTRDLDDYRRAYGVLYVRGGLAVALPGSNGLFTTKAQRAQRS